MVKICRGLQKQSIVDHSIPHISGRLHDVTIQQDAIKLHIDNTICMVVRIYTIFNAL